MNVYHRLNTDKVKNVSPDNYCLLELVVENGDEHYCIESQFAKLLKIYLYDLEKYAKQNLGIKDYILENYLRIQDLRKFQKNEEGPFNKVLRQELSIVSKLLHQKGGDGISLAHLIGKITLVYNKYEHDIISGLDRQIKYLYLEDVKKVFIKSADVSGDKDMFNFSNFLLHFINWENSFYDFYETTRDLLYNPLKKIESRFSYELTLSLKAYLSFRSKLNALLRHFENQEDGKLGITYIDWEMEVKQVLKDEFEKIFGKPKSNEFIKALDNLIVKSLLQGKAINEA